MTSEAPNGGVRMPRWLYAGLIASLAVNLLFVGSLGGAFLHQRHGKPHGMSSRGGEDVGLLGFVRKLPKDKQAAIREQVKTGRENLQPLREASNEAWLAGNKVLAQEPFDQEKVKAAFVRMTEAETKLKMAIGDILSSMASQLTPDERQMLSEWREVRKPRKKR